MVTDTNHLQENAAAEMESAFGACDFLMEMKVFGGNESLWTFLQVKP